MNLPLSVDKTVLDKKLECRVCRERFCNNQGLSVHMKCKHGCEQTSNRGTFRDQQAETKQTSSSAAEVENERSDIGSRNIEKRRGSQHRTSRTNLFKSKIIELRESGKTLTEISDLFPGIALSQISKWTKD